MKRLRYYALTVATIGPVIGLAFGALVGRDYLTWMGLGFIGSGGCALVLYLLWRMGLTDEEW